VYYTDFTFISFVKKGFKTIGLLGLYVSGQGERARGRISGGRSSRNRITGYDNIKRFIRFAIKIVDALSYNKHALHSALHPLASVCVCCASVLGIKISVVIRVNVYYRETHT